MPTLHDQFDPIISSLEIEPQRKDFLRARWLEQLEWLDAKAAGARKRYYRLRLTTVIGAVLLPALVSLRPSDDGLDNAVRILTWVISVIVAASAAVEQLFHYGATWRNYRHTSELLKAEGWRYFQLAGAYGVDGTTHQTAYRSFAQRVEELIQTDVEVYLTEVAAEQEPKKPDGPPGQ